jgi:hypothetical protein
MNNIFDALEICLSEMENGADMETVLARFPNLAGELRPILETSMKARDMSAAEPSPESIRRGRARVMQRAAEMRESKAAPRKRAIPAFQRLALSFSLAAVLLLSGTGLLNASASALPGENLYPVKRTWEGLRLLLIFDKEARTLLEDQFEYERLHEVNKLLTEGRHTPIQFAGVFMQVNGKTYVSGVPVMVPANLALPANGAAVILKGQTNPQGVVEVASLELLPDGSVVPVGNPIEMEVESESNSNNAVKPAATPQYYAMEGTLQALSSTTMVVNGLTVYPDNAKIEGELCIGARVEVEGYFASSGRFMVVKVEAKGSCSTGSGENNNSSGSSGSNSNSGDGNDDNLGGNDHGGNDNGDDDSNDDHGGDKDSNDNNDD